MIAHRAGKLLKLCPHHDDKLLDNMMFCLNGNQCHYAEVHIINTKLLYFKNVSITKYNKLTLINMMQLINL